MLVIQDIEIKEVPCLVIENSVDVGKPLPLFVYHHGFQSAREHSLPIGYMLANKGFRVILPDALHHGVRENGINAFERSLAFWDIVMKNVEDTKLIYDYYQKQNLIENKQFFVAGTSMGGITTAAALVAHDFITGAGLLMGTAMLGSYAELLGERVRKEGARIADSELEAAHQMILPFDLSGQLEKLNRRPLFIWHGEKDSVIPFSFAKEFYEKAKEYYPDNGEITFMKAPGVGHKVNRAAMLAAADWFGSFISKDKR
ncbi:alpha/beta hydrolase [Aciduricibacillus chroicocephali]|uniref:Alpha/beta hydrolase n=1 Tax=Aciduricibacillus chroicocephali TaxID=3054939 RepID=A0ABY9L0X6_9BACI|nr:alpha/beta hydrolase [Bacillaceae bacterium 44XB]